MEWFAGEGVLRVLESGKPVLFCAIRWWCKPQARENGVSGFDGAPKREVISTQIGLAPGLAGGDQWSVHQAGASGCSVNLWPKSRLWLAALDGATMAYQSCVAGHVVGKCTGRA